ncbi:MAG: hypothetical protein AAGL99_18795, partial [Pseudomonadota bacterium]
PSGADRNPEPERHPESRPHDETPIFRLFPSPALTALVNRWYCFNAIHAPRREPYQSQKTYKDARLYPKDRATDPSKPDDLPKLKPTSGT